MAGLRKLQKETTHRRILEAALELFESRGYVTTTIEDIAEAAGTTRVTFYAHFDSRQDLMRALLKELNGILGRRDDPGRGSTASPLVGVVRSGSRELISQWLHEQSAQWPSIAPYLVSATEASAIDPEIRSVFHSWFEEVIQDIKEGLDLADRFDPSSRRTRSEFALVTLDHAALSWIRERRSRHPDSQADPALEVLGELWWKLLGDT